LIRFRSLAAGVVLFGTSCALVGSYIQAGQERGKCADLAEAPVPVSEEYALGGSLAVQFVGATGLVLDASHATAPKYRLANYLNVVGRNLGAQSQRPTLEWTFGILDQDEPNAFSTPGGYVFVSKGLLKQLDNESQLAGILGHEIAHITQRHAIKQYQGVKSSLCTSDMAQQMVVATVGTVAEPLTGSLAGQLLASLGSATGLDLDKAINDGLLKKLADDLGTALHNAGYGKEDEFEADRLGADLALTAGYNPHEFIHYLRRLPSGSAVLSHHPPSAEREQALESWLNDVCSKKATLLAEDDCPFTSYSKVDFSSDIKGSIKAL
jgi:predicted Zn-dependent protease